MASQTRSRISLAREAARKGIEDKARRRVAHAAIPSKGPAGDAIRQERNRIEREIALRMVKRFYPLRKDGTGGAPDPIVLLYAYWQARRCGWDALSPMIARTRLHLPCTPSESPVWVWWMNLHYTRRRMIAGASSHRLIRASK